MSILLVTMVLVAMVLLLVAVLVLRLKNRQLLVIVNNDTQIIRSLDNVVSDFADRISNQSQAVQLLEFASPHIHWIVEPVEDDPGPMPLAMAAGGNA